jgi:translation initiation factor 2 alpha subunit (eIF-2alpha)
MTTYQYYSNKNPTIGEIVLVEFSARTESFFDAKLIEYPYRGMMSYSDASKKRRISSWNKIIPLNKHMVARVDEIDTKNEIVQISIAYLDEMVDDKNLSLTDIQNKLMIQFNENKLLESFIKSLCIQSTCNFKIIWESLVHHIDSKRRIFNDENNENNENDDKIPISLWKYFCDNISDLSEWCTISNINDETRDIIYKLYIKRTEETIKKINSKIKIISPHGISHTHKLLNDCLNTITFKYTFKYISTPDYILESSTEDSSITDHKKIIDILKVQSQNMTPKVFIQVLDADIAKLIG